MKVPRSNYDDLIEFLCLLCLIGTGIYLAVKWASIPAMVPAHYNAAGEIDRMGSKGNLIFLYGTAWMMYVLMLVFEHLPQTWNTGVKVTEENKERVYRVIKNLLVTTKLLCTVDFCYMIFPTVKNEPMPALFLPLVLILLFGSILWTLLWLRKVK